MKSLLLVCLVVVIYGVFVDNSVLAKTICRCDTMFPMQDMFYSNPTKACTSGFYCYHYFFTFFCEVNRYAQKRFDACCIEQSERTTGIRCSII